jgi:hypothetical protein
MTPLERVRRADEQLLHVLLYKQQALAEWGGAGDDVNALADTLANREVAELRATATCREMVLSAVVHANRLLDAINEGVCVVCARAHTPMQACDCATTCRYLVALSHCRRLCLRTVSDVQTTTTCPVYRVSH